MVKVIQYILGVILLLLVIIMTVYYHHFSSTQTEEEEQSMKHSMLQYNNKYKPHISNTSTTTNDLSMLQAYIKQQNNEIIALKSQLKQAQQTDNNNNINKNLHVPTESSSSSSYIVPRRYSLETPPSTLQQVRLSHFTTLLLYIISYDTLIPLHYTTTGL